VLPDGRVSKRQVPRGKDSYLRAAEDHHRLWVCRGFLGELRDDVSGVGADNQGGRRDVNNRGESRQSAVEDAPGQHSEPENPRAQWATEADIWEVHGVQCHVRVPGCVRGVVKKSQKSIEVDSGEAIFEDTLGEDDFSLKLAGEKGEGDEEGDEEGEGVWCHGQGLVSNDSKKSQRQVFKQGEKKEQKKEQEQGGAGGTRGGGGEE